MRKLIVLVAGLLAIPEVAPFRRTAYRCSRSSAIARSPRIHVPALAVRPLYTSLAWLAASRFARVQRTAFCYLKQKTERLAALVGA